MRSVFLLVIIAVMMTTSPSWATIYHAPPALLKEAKINEDALLASPNVNTYFELAMSQAYTGQIEKGWENLKKIPNYDEHYAAKVIEKYSRLSEKEPKEWKHFFKLAFGYRFTEQKDKALACFYKVLDIDPKNIWAMGFIGLVEGEKGNTDKGIEWSLKALAIEPNATAIHFLLAEGYRRKGDYFKAFSEILTVGRLKSEEKLAK